ncbi:MAG: glycosyltransferase [Fastidiosipilaceae bacterium]|jgi:glycosyltransferase involved in cell wall biosynthesis|nr:glycosyltransferase [Clostridiaceae bacterium]
MKISFVIPCYKSSQNIHIVVDEILEAMATRPDVDYEIIMVNDCSPDNTAEVLNKLATENDKMIAVDLAKNVGQANALLAGFGQATGDYIMTSDDDGQTPVGRVFDFLEEMEKGYDVVCARYVDRHQPSLFRRMGSAVNRAMSDWLIEKPEGVYMAAFFMAKRFVIDEMIKYRHSFPYISALILRVTQKVGNVDLVQRERASGSSGYTLGKLFKLWLNGFTSVSIKPLRLAVKTGAVIAVIGFIWAIFNIIRKCVLPHVAVGWTSIIAVLLFTQGVVLLFLGLIGEYIGRIYMGINDTPQYVIRSITRK